MGAAHASFVEPQLATLSREPFTDPDWLFERKLDGVRTVAVSDGDQTRLWSRSHNNVSVSYPEIVEALDHQLSGTTYVLDGEILAFEDDKTSFAALQPRIHLTDPRRIARSSVKIWYYVFDLLHYDGHDARPLRLVDRKRLLAQLSDWPAPLRYVDHVLEHGEKLYSHALEAGWEGIIAKRADSRYRSGRSRDWLKLKAVHEQEFVVGGYTPPRGSRASLGSLLVGYYDDHHRLQYAGSVGTGYTHAELTRLHAELQKRHTDTSPFETTPRITPAPQWVQPGLVVQVSYSEWTRAKQLRHPTYLGQRTDKDPREVTAQA